jgi:hypothetical protein
MPVIEKILALHEAEQINPRIVFNEQRELILTYPNASADRVQALADLALNVEQHGENGICIFFDAESNLFYNDIEFLSHFVYSEHPGVVGLLHCSEENQSYQVFDFDGSKKQNITGISDSPDCFISNTYKYLQIKNIFKSMISTNEDIISNSFILYLQNNHQFPIGYPLIPPVYREGSKLGEKFGILEAVCSNEEKKILLRKRIIEYLEFVPIEVRFITFIDKLEIIVEATQRDYDVFITQFNFDEVKDKFQKTRDSYFTSIRTDLDQLIGKIVVIPISAATAILAINQAPNDPNLIMIIIFVFSLFALSMGFLLREQGYVVNENKQNVSTQFAKLIELFPDASSLFKHEFDTIIERFSILNNVIILTQVVVILISLALVDYFLCIKPLSIIIRICILAFLLSAYLLLTVFWEYDKKN